ncbi:hypothetical protein VTN31DRAFT_5685 [Thermomyces dupontii]|uniref:uncharacterized protein n=1 Tax=Talaromyces thermophilus TaxID=28565 RepID=UPI0037437B7B
MPLIILTGYPCSGLTYRAQQLASLLDATQQKLLASTSATDDAPQRQPPPRYKIHIVPTHDASHPRTVYDNARSEKEARAVAFARVKRALSRDTIVILDGMNYIKGVRYQLWCEAKAVGTTCCVVHVGTPIDKCVAINNARLRREQQQLKPQSQTQSSSEAQNEVDGTGDDLGLAAPDNEPPYPPDLLDNLIYRYEEPSTHNRWDKPLFTVPWSDAAPPVEEIFSAITGIPIETNPPTTSLTSLPADQRPAAPTDTSTVAGSIATTAAGGSGRFSRAKVKPHQATVQAATTDPTALYGFEKRTTAIINAIRAFTQENPSAEAALAKAKAQSPSTPPAGITIPVPESSTPVFVPSHVALSATTDDLGGVGGVLAWPRLQRLRRQWIGLNRAYVGQNHGHGSGGLSVDQVGDAFVRFLNAELAGENRV